MNYYRTIIFMMIVSCVQLRGQTQSADQLIIIQTQLGRDNKSILIEIKNNGKESITILLEGNFPDYKTNSKCLVGHFQLKHNPSDIKKFPLIPLSRVVDIDAFSSALITLSVPVTKSENNATFTERQLTAIDNSAVAQSFKTGGNFYFGLIRVKQMSAARP